MFELEIFTPNKPIYTGQVKMAIVPGIKGQFGVLQNHAPFISKINSGLLAVFKESDNNQTDSFFIMNGVAEVKDNKCRILVKFAEDAANIDLAAENKELEAVNAEIARADKESVAYIKLLSQKDILEQKIAALSENH